MDERNANRKVKSSTEPKPSDMKRLLIPLLAALILSCPHMALAWGGGGSSSWPQANKKKKAPPAKRTFKAPLPPSLPPEHREVVSAVSYYTQFRSRDGYYVAKDKKVNTGQWHLKSSARPEIKKIDETHYEVTEKFLGSTTGEGEQVPVTVLFKLTGSGKDWKVKSAKIRSVNGVAR